MSQKPASFAVDCRRELFQVQNLSDSDFISPPAGLPDASEFGPSPPDPTSRTTGTSGASRPCWISIRPAGTSTTTGTRRPRDKCAPDLILEHFFPDGRTLETYRRLNPWLELTAVHDCHGFGAAAELIGLSNHDYARMGSPVEYAVLQSFGSVGVVPSGSLLEHYMVEIGRLIMSEVREVRDFQQADLSALPEPTDLNGIRLWDVRGVDTAGKRLAKNMLQTEALNRGVDVLLSHSAKQDSLTLYAGDTGRVDLSDLHGRDGVIFAHKAGFFAVYDVGTPEKQIREDLRTLDKP